MSLVLIVTRDPRTRAAVSHALIDVWGVETADTEQISEVAELLSERPAELVICDLDSVGEGGLKTARIACAARPPVPVLLLAEHPEPFRSRLPESDQIAYCDNADHLKAMIVERVGVVPGADSPFSVADSIQFACMGTYSTVITVFGGDEELGRVVVQEGEVWSALAGEESGRVAVRSLVFYPKARAVMSTLSGGPGPRNINETSAHLLLDLAREQDELEQPMGLRQLTPAPLTQAPAITSEASGNRPRRPPRPAGSGAAPAASGAARPAFIGAAAAALLLGGAYLLTRSPEPARVQPRAAEISAADLSAADVSTTEAPPLPKTSLDRADVEKLLIRGDELMKRRRFEAARELLGSLETELIDDADQRIRLHELIDDARVGYGLMVAQQALASGALGKASREVRGVLLRRPSEPEALRLLAAIEATKPEPEPEPEKPTPTAPRQPAFKPKKPAPRVQSVSFRSIPAGLILVDGDALGQTPIDGVRLALGRHRVEIRQETHEPLSRIIHVDRNTSVLSFVLKKRPAPAAPAPEPSKPTLAEPTAPAPPPAAPAPPPSKPAGVAPAPPAPRRRGFMIVASAAGPSQLAAATVGAFLRGKRHKLGGARAIWLFSRQSRAVVGRFVRRAAGISLAELQAIEVKRKHRGRGRSTTRWVSTDAAVMHAVRGRPGTFGVISAGPIPAGVRVVDLR